MWSNPAVTTTTPAIPDSIRNDLGTGPGSSRELVVGTGASGPSLAAARAAAAELEPEQTLLMLVEGRPAAHELAACRNVLWPDVHLVRVYRSDAGALLRDTLQGTERVEGTSNLDGTLLVGRRREHVLAPDFTVEKFDANAKGWNGNPGSAGYVHFRWMRRYVARFAGSSAGARRILDFGSGAGWVGIEAALRNPGAALCAFDPSPAMVRTFEENARACGIGDFTGRTGFGEDPPCPAEGEEPYDLVLSSGVISFSPDAERWLDGLVRTLAPGATLVIGDLYPDSRGMRSRRRKRVLLPVRELNARTPADVRAGLERRGLVYETGAGYQLTSPMPQAMHVNETRLGGALKHPLLWINKTCTALDHACGGALAAQFDSWVMRLVKP
jgi:SAM-dependent methyltransferase